MPPLVVQHHFYRFTGLFGRSPVVRVRRGGDRKSSAAIAAVDPRPYHGPCGVAGRVQERRNVRAAKTTVHQGTPEVIQGSALPIIAECHFRPKKIKYLRLKHHRRAAVSGALVTRAARDTVAATAPCSRAGASRSNRFQDLRKLSAKKNTTRLRWSTVDVDDHSSSRDRFMHGPADERSGSNYTEYGDRHGGVVLQEHTDD
jgi:hypothetical protein